MSIKNYTREEFLQTITQATLGSFGLLSVFSKNPFNRDETSANLRNIPKEAVILFQGDSITDAGRNKQEMSPNTSSGLGNGYAFMASSSLLYEFPDHNLRCYNRGISGDKVFQLAERWQADCLNLKPDILSILVGVNDFWHTLDFDYEGTAETYEQDYRELLKRTQKRLPDTTLLIGEPFALKGSSAIDDNWYPKFPKYQAAAKDIARDFGAAFIPYQTIFDKAGKQTGDAYWSADGVHPTIAGSQLMARAWFETIKRL